MNSSRIEDKSGMRFPSGAIDYIIIFAFTFGYIMLVGKSNTEGGKTVTGFPGLVPMLFWFCWLVLAEVFFGTTLGHFINGLKIVSMEGGKPSFSQSLRRRLCDVVEISWCFGLIAYLIIKNTKLHQRLGDIWARTLVVDKNFEFNSPNFEFEETGNIEKDSSYVQTSAFDLMTKFTKISLLV
jgi:uncharacterized RDD family membrane protein YckC